MKHVIIIIFQLNLIYLIVHTLSHINRVITKINEFAFITGKRFNSYNVCLRVLANNLNYNAQIKNSGNVIQNKLNKKRKHQPISSGILNTNDEDVISDLSIDNDDNQFLEKSNNNDTKSVNDQIASLLDNGQPFFNDLNNELANSYRTSQIITSQTTPVNKYSDSIKDLPNSDKNIVINDIITNYSDEISSNNIKTHSFNSNRSDSMNKRVDAYSRLQTIVKLSENTLKKHNILDDVQNYVPLLHWNLWHNNIRDKRKCNWSNEQYEQYVSLLGKIGELIDNTLLSAKSLIQDVPDYDKCGMPSRFKDENVVEPNFAYKLLKNNLESYKIDMYNLRMRSISTIISYMQKTMLRFFRRPYFVHTSSYIKKIFKYISNFFGLNVFQNTRRHNTYMLTLDSIFRYYGSNNLVLDKQQTKTLVHRNTLYNNPPLLGNWRVTFLGTGSRQPTTTRLTSSMVFMKSPDSRTVWLFDCGEGSRIAMEENGINPKYVDRIFLTHLHGDHCFGIFSFIYQRDRPTPVTVYGPIGTKKFIEQIHKSTSYGILNCNVFELTDQYPHDVLDCVIRPNNDGYYEVFEGNDCIVLAAHLKHTMPTVGYVIKEKNNNKQRKRKIVICQDTSNSDKMLPIAMDADLLIHEATSSAPTLRLTNVLLNLIDEYKDATFNRNILKDLDEFFTDYEIKSNSFGNTKTSAIYSIRRDRLDITKRFESVEYDISSLGSRPDKSISNDNNRRNYKQMKDNWYSCINGLISRLRALHVVEKLYDKAVNIKNKSLLVDQLDILLSRYNDSDKINHYIIETITKILSDFVITNNSDLLKSNDTDTKVFSDIVQKNSEKIVKYWKDNFTQFSPICINNTYDWRDFHDNMMQCFGHSTAHMAGKFAANINAKRLVLTHFASRYKGDSDLPNVLTMVRVQHDARKGVFSVCEDEDKRRNIQIISAWDSLIISV